jgi:hypothetical protein
VAAVNPVTGVSRLAQHGISAALSISEHVEAVTVVRSGTGEESGRVRELQRQWLPARGMRATMRGRNARVSQLN